MKTSMSRAELLALPASTDLKTLGRAFGISEPVARERHRRGEFDELGIRVVRLGAQWRVITADILRVLGIAPTTITAGPVSPGPASDPALVQRLSRADRTLAE